MGEPYSITTEVYTGSKREADIRLHAALEEIRRLEGVLTTTRERLSEFEPEMWSFFAAMSRKFRSHIPDRGHSYLHMTDQDISSRIWDEVREAFDGEREEWADVANFAFFGWETHARRKGERSE